jgi:hypothetical protein
MATRRERSLLPGSDALEVQKLFLLVFLVMCLIIVGFALATAAHLGAHGGHLRWPIVQWAVATPLGLLALTLSGALLAGLPLVLTMIVGFRVYDPVDVTDLPLSAWSPRTLPPWRRADGLTRSQHVLGRGLAQRSLSVLALAVAVLVMLGLFALYSAIAWYGISHYPACAASGCPPVYGYIQGPVLTSALAIMFLSQYARVRYIERHCRIWFRAPASTTASVKYYVRRPGVSAAVAAATLARYSAPGAGSERPLAWSSATKLRCSSRSCWC